MSSAARAQCVTYLPIDGLIANLEDAVEELGEIESRRGNTMFADAARLEQIQRLRDCGASVICALQLAREYAKGPTA